MVSNNLTVDTFLYLCEHQTGMLLLVINTCLLSYVLCVGCSWKLLNAQPDHSSYVSRIYNNDFWLPVYLLCCAVLCIVTSIALRFLEFFSISNMRTEGAVVVPTIKPWGLCVRLVYINKIDSFRIMSKSFLDSTPSVNKSSDLTHNQIKAQSCCWTDEAEGAGLQEV